MWLGDSASDLGGPSPCTLDETAGAFECVDPDGGAPFAGTITSSSGQLTLELSPCPTAASECREVYERAPDVRCP